MGYAATTRAIIYWNPAQPFIYASHIILGLINIIITYPDNTSTPPVLYCFIKSPKVFFIIITYSTSIYVNLILNILHFVIQQFSHMKLSYLFLKMKLVLMYWVINISQSLMSLIQSQIHHLVVNLRHRLIISCV